MASETTDPIYWSHPHLNGQYLWASRAYYKSVQPQPGIDLATFSMRGNHLAYAATRVPQVQLRQQLFAKVPNVYFLHPAPGSSIMMMGRTSSPWVERLDPSRTSGPGSNKVPDRSAFKFFGFFCWCKKNKHPLSKLGKTFFQFSSRKPIYFVAFSLAVIYLRFKIHNR